MPEIDLTAWLQRTSETAVLIIRDSNWVFSHDKLRQTILASLRPAERRETHGRVAEAIERCYPNDARFTARLLDQWQAAGNEEKELIYLLPVAQSLIDYATNLERAARLLERGLDLLPAEDKRCMPFLNKLSVAYWRQGAYEDGQKAAKQALQLATQANDQAELGAWTQKYRRDRLFSWGFDNRPGKL